MSLSPGNETAAAAERFVPGAEIAPVDGRSWLVRASNATGVCSVRQIDPSLAASRVELIHEFLGRPELLHATPLLGVEREPARSFDARRWIEGAQLGTTLASEEWQSLHLPAHIEAGELGEVASALAAFHRTGTTSSLIARAPRLRIKELLASTRRSLELNERALAGEIRKESRARRWLTASRPLLANAESNLEHVDYLRDETLVMAHLDLWGSHIVHGESGITLLDCETVGAAPAVTDIAQLIARNGAWSDERVEQALTGYSADYPLPPSQRRMLPWLTALEAISSCGLLLARAHAERRPLSDSDRRLVFAGADQQLEQLQAMASAFVPPPARPYRRPGRRTGGAPR